MTYAMSTAQPVTTYERSHEDIIVAITTALVANIGTRNYHRARIDFRLLKEVIDSRGRHGKDIRYAEKVLGELARAAREEGQDEIRRLASAYTVQLPIPVDTRRRSNERLEEMVA